MDLLHIKPRMNLKLISSTASHHFSCSFLCLLYWLWFTLDTNKKASLCVKMLANAMLSYPKLKGGNSAFRSRQPVYESGVSKSCSRLRDSVKHEQCRLSLSWQRTLWEHVGSNEVGTAFYGRYDTQTMTTDELKVLIWRYFMSYWNNRRICSRNGGLPPMVKHQQFYDSLDADS